MIVNNKELEAISCKVIEKYNAVAKSCFIKDEKSHIDLIRSAKALKNSPHECKQSDRGEAVPTKPSEDAEFVKHKLAEIASQIDELCKNVREILAEEDSLARYLILKNDNENSVHDFFTKLITFEDARDVFAAASKMSVLKGRKPKPDWNKQVVELGKIFWQEEFGIKPTVSYKAGGGDIPNNDFTKWITLFMNTALGVRTDSIATLLKKKNKKYTNLVESDYS